MPECASVRHMVPVQRPLTSGSMNMAFCSGEPCRSMVSIAPWESPEYIAHDQFAVPFISRTVVPSDIGRPCPPYSAGWSSDGQPPSMYC